MKSPFSEYVINLFRDKVPLETILEQARNQFKSSTICLYQVKNVIDNFQRGLITESGEFKRKE